MPWVMQRFQTLWKALRLYSFHPIIIVGFIIRSYSFFVGYLLVLSWSSSWSVDCTLYFCFL